MTNNRTTTARPSGVAAILADLKTGTAFDRAKVDKLTKTFRDAGKTWQDRAEALAVAAMHLSLPHEDGGHNCPARAIALVNAFPQGSRVKALVGWFHDFTNIRLRYDTKVKAYTGGVLKPTDKSYRKLTPEMLAAAAGKPFYSIAEAAPAVGAFTTDNFAKRVAALLKAATDANAKLDAKGTAALADLKVLAAKLEPAK